MGLEDLVSCIELLQQRMRAHGTALRENETRTRMALIDPLLNALGWDPNDASVVMPEYKVSDGWADYALLRPDGHPAAVIEAKKLGTMLDVKFRRQMLNYANESGIEYAGLTDGNNWELYTVFQPGPLEERQILKACIAADPPHASALRLLTLWRPNLTSGEPVPASEPIIDVLDDPRPDPVETAPPPRPTEPDWVALSGYEPMAGTPSPTAIRFWDGEQSNLEYWYQLLTSVVEKLFRDGRLSVDDLPIGWSPNAYSVHTKPVHPTGKEFIEFRQIEGTPLFVNVYLNAQQARNATKRLLTRYKQDPSEVFLQVAQ